MSVINMLPTGGGKWKAISRHVTVNGKTDYVIDCGFKPRAVAYWTPGTSGAAYESFYTWLDGTFFQSYLYNGQPLVLEVSGKRLTIKQPLGGSNNQSRNMELYVTVFGQ